MTISEKIAMLNVLTGETISDSTAGVYLDLAADIVLSRAYPYGAESAEVPLRYEIVQVRIAACLYLKRGAEGETSHSENGITRRYEAASVPESLLKQIIPCVKVVSRS